MSTAYDKVMTSRKQLVDKVIRMIQEGYHKNAAKWNRVALRPHNPESGAVYRGGNRLKLMVVAMEQGYEDPRWMTFKQMQGAGYQLKRGQHGVLCEKWIFTERKKQLNEKGEEEFVEVPLDKPKVAYFYVYNAQQIENYPELVKNELDPDLLTLAEQLKESSECPVYEMAQDRAFYNRSGDYICLPLRDYFKDAQSFVGTLIHEMGHSTGHESRLGRKFGTKFGDPDYAREELRAELGALFLEADLGLESGAEILEDHSDYLKSWISALRDDPNELFRACADADKISARLMENYRRQLEKGLKKEGEEKLEDEEYVKTDQKTEVEMELKGVKDAEQVNATSSERKYPPVYLDSAVIAVEQGRREEYWESWELNVACKEAVEEAIRNFDGVYLLHDVVKPILEEYGQERLAYVLVSTLRQKTEDGRFSRDNKVWAENYEFYGNKNIVLSPDFLVDIDPGQLDRFIDLVRKEFEELEKVASQETEDDMEPVVHIVWSEHPDLTDDSYLPLHVANQLFRELDEQQVQTRQKSNYKGVLYYKTSFEILYRMAGMVHTYEGRQDFGDGNGHLINHIRMHAEHYKNDEVWRAEVLRREGSEAWEQKVQSYDDTLYGFVPYLELHSNLGKILENDERMLKLYGSVETPEKQEYAAYHKELEAYVTACREQLNSGAEDAFQLPDPPEFAKISSKVQERQEIDTYKEMVEQEIQQEAASYGMTVEEYAANGYEPPVEYSKEEAKSPDPDAVQIEKALQNRENTDHGIYHDVGAVLEQFTTAQLISYYLSQGNDQSLRSYLEEQITQNEISKNRERALEKLGLQGEECKEFDEQSGSIYLRRYGVDAEGNAYRTYNGKRPEEFNQEETLLFMANTDLTMYGSLTEDMQNLLKSEGYMYANGRLEKLQPEKEAPKQTSKRIIK